MTTRTVALVLTFALVAASCGHQVECSLSASIIVDVKDAGNGQPVPGAFVETRVGGTLLATTNCDTSAGVSRCILGGGAGTYDLTIGAPSYQSTRRPVVVPRTRVGLCDDVVTQTVDVALVQ